MVKAVYIHIPFCRKICSYCDFCKFFYQEQLVDQYLIQLQQEMQERYQNDLIDTIYIGGGTPSCLSVSQLEKLFDCICCIQTSKNLEFTFECNIHDITEELLSFLKRNQVNRLSIGVETFHSELLSFLGREEQKQEMISKIQLAKSYFENLNLDFIYAIPQETMTMLQEDLEMFLSFSIPHISTYSLMIEEHTSFGIQKIQPIEEELDFQMYQEICSTLEKNGYLHYEISNFCKPGYESKHNLTYWQNQEYYGFGVGASGYLGKIRYTNTRSITNYLKGQNRMEQEEMTEQMEASNQAILGLRTKKGISKEDFFKHFQKDFIEYFQVKDLLDEKILMEEKGNYFISPNYWYLSNEILERFL